MSAEHEKLEQAIATLEAQRAILGDLVVEASIAALKKQLAELEPTPPVEQQRKQVTVLFADISGFTAMSETMDAEDINEVMNALWQRFDKTIINHGGFIDKHIGDAVMAIWGADTAREDDPEQAIRAALFMQMELMTFNQHQRVKLGMRIGINTGRVLLGEVGTTGEFTAIGDAVNIASRLEHAAPVSEILISHDTYRHVRGVFDVLLQDPLTLRGKTEPLQTYIVRAARPRAFRMSTRGVEGIETRMIGREAELKRLQDAMYAAIEDNEQQTVTIVGEAGIGKSRLLYEFDNWIDLLPETVHYFKGRSQLETQNVPYGLIRDLLAFRFQIQESDTVPIVWQKMEQGIVDVLGVNEQSQMKAHFVGQLLGFDFSRSQYLQLVADDSTKLRSRGLAYLQDFFTAVAAILPVVVLLEDLHWADDSSLDLLNHLAGQMRSQPLLIVCTARPVLFERRPYWGEGQGFHIQLNLYALSKRESRHLVSEILRKIEHLPDALRELVASGAEGNPFYIEELIKMLIEDEVIIKGEEVWYVKPERLVLASIPATLTGVLQARLDALPIVEKIVLQRASVIGRIFWDDALTHLGTRYQSNHDHNNIDEALANLRSKEMIFHRETSAFAGIQEYIFKHTILRDVTYDSVLKREREVYHARVAEWLIKRSGERVKEYAGLVAEHFELGGQMKQAIAYLRQAAMQAVVQNATLEAVAYLNRALDFSRQNQIDNEQMGDLLRHRGNLLHRIGDQTASLADLEEYFNIASHDKMRIDALSLIGRQHSQMGEHQKALGAHREALQLATALNDTEGRARGYSGVGWALWGLGRLEEAWSNLDKALGLFNQLNDIRQQRRVWNLLGITYLGMGKIDKSIAAYEAALALEDHTLDNWERAILLGNLGESYQCLFDMEQALVYHEEAMRLAEMIEAPSAVADICRNMGVDLVYLGETERGIEHLYTALTLSEDTGQPDIKMQTLYHLVLAELESGNVVTAHEHATTLRQLAEAGQATGYLADAYHALGFCHQHLQDITTARQLWQQAILIAHEAGKQMLIWQLHAALASIVPTPELAEEYKNEAAKIIYEIVEPIENGVLRQKFINAPPVQAVLQSVRQD